MEANMQVKSGGVLDKCIDMSKVKLDAIKAQINTKIYDVFQIKKFVYNELKLEQFISPIKMHNHMTEFLNGPRVKQFICELWPILLEAEESAASIRNATVEPKKNEILKKANQNLRKDGEQSQSTSQPLSIKQSNILNGGKKSLVPPKTLNSSLKPQGRIDISKLKLDMLKPWINTKITDILRREDNTAVEFVYNKLKQDQMLCPKKLQIRIAGFLNGDKAQKFVCELWPLLLSAQESESGIPAELMQEKKEENIRTEKDTNHREKHNGSASLSLSTKAEQKQHLTTSTLNTKNQQPDKENNKNSINIGNHATKLDKSVTKNIQVDNKKSSKRSGDCPSRSRDKERKHCSRSTSHKKSSSKAVSQSRERGSDDGKACGTNGFANTCMFSPKQLQQETKAISQDQRRSTLFPEFLSEYCPQTDDFLNLWNEGPDKETILLSEKFVYPNAKNIEKQINITLMPPLSSVSKSDHEQQKRNIDIDKIIKTEQEIKAARKRTHSTMSSENKKSESDSSNKDAQQPAKKKQRKSPLKRSSDKDSSKKSEAASSKKKTHEKYSSAMKERMLELFGSCSSDEDV